jgi:negative regulator of genetic competence, sporulation and motility
LDFLVISNNKLKIKMNKKEMKRYSMNVPEEEYSSHRIRAALWQVLDLAHSECGFSVEGERMLVQIYPSEGGCDIFVTKLGRLSASAERNIARSGSVTMLSSKSTLYKFSDLSTLLLALRHITPSSASRLADAYLAEEGVCYLLVEDRTGAVPLSELSVLSEFATEVPTVLLTHLSEHAHRISAQDLFSIINKKTVAG